jgi:hypothetical protein
VQPVHEKREKTRSQSESMMRERGREGGREGERGKSLWNRNMMVIT